MLIKYLYFASAIIAMFTRLQVKDNRDSHSSTDYIGYQLLGGLYMYSSPESRSRVGWLVGLSRAKRLRALLKLTSRFSFSRYIQTYSRAEDTPDYATLQNMPCGFTYTKLKNAHGAVAG
jgi:flavin-dependent dehydrogenase